MDNSFFKSFLKSFSTIIGCGLSIVGAAQMQMGRIGKMGIECYSNYRTKTGATIPTPDINVGGSIVWNVGVSFGLNNGSDNVIVESILQMS